MRTGSHETEMAVELMKYPVTFEAASLGTKNVKKAKKIVKCIHRIFFLQRICVIKRAIEESC